MLRSGEPFTVNVPSSNSRSSSDTSSWCATMLRAFAMIFSPACQSAMPPTVSDLLPYVSIPSCDEAVSPWITSTSSTLTPSWSATICANVVSWLCPWGEVPVTTWTEPSGWKRIVAASQPPTA